MDTARRQPGLVAAPGVDAAGLREGVLHFPPRGAAFASLD
jgi:hypothetical protein